MPGDTYRITAFGRDAGFLPRHAWISYNGYNVKMPAQLGHVFEVTWSGLGAATWVDRSYNLPDFPITAVARDDLTGDLYAASDFGVIMLPEGDTTWVVAGGGLPMVEVAGPTIVPNARGYCTPRRTDGARGQCNWRHD